MRKMSRAVVVAVEPRFEKPVPVVVEKLDDTVDELLQRIAIARNAVD